MPMDYTVIQAVRQRFGNAGAPAGERYVFSNAPFVGPSMEYRFDCPGIDASQMGVLQFITVGVDTNYTGDLYDLPDSIIRINGVDLPGGLQPGDTGRRVGDDFLPTWKSQVLLVPQNVLLASGNALYIEAAAMQFFNITWRDAFVIDNIVLFYKTFSVSPVTGYPRA